MLPFTESSWNMEYTDSYCAEHFVTWNCKIMDVEKFYNVTFSL